MTDPKPGWYPDPEQTATQRYWDGEGWTENRAPAAPEDKGAGALVAIGYVTAVLLPIVGFILGIVLLVRRQTGHGLAVFSISLIVGFAACALVLNDAEDEFDSYAECIEDARTVRAMNAC